MMLIKVLVACCLITNIGSGQYLRSGAILQSSHDFMVNITIVDKIAALIVMVGPADLWFGVGWGSDAMSGTYATIVTDGNNTVVERSLGYYTGGTVLDSTITVIADATSSGIRGVAFYRNASAPSSDYYDFSSVTNTSEIDIIWAVGSSSSFGQHNSTNRGSRTLNFGSSDITTTAESDITTTAEALITTATTNEMTSGSTTTAEGLMTTATTNEMMSDSTTTEVDIDTSTTDIDTSAADSETDSDTSTGSHISIYLLPLLSVLTTGLIISIV